jgi:hypothetical protein
MALGLLGPSGQRLQSDRGPWPPLAPLHACTQSGPSPHARVTLLLCCGAGPALAPLVADPAVVKVLHGADSDVVWLQRDFGLFLVNMFDTGQVVRAAGCGVCVCVCVMVVVWGAGRGWVGRWGGKIQDWQGQGTGPRAGGATSIRV